MVQKQIRQEVSLARLARDFGLEKEQKQKLTKFIEKLEKQPRFKVIEEEKKRFLHPKTGNLLSNNPKERKKQLTTTKIVKKKVKKRYKTGKRKGKFFTRTVKQRKKIVLKPKVSKTVRFFHPITNARLTKREADILKKTFQTMRFQTRVRGNFVIVNSRRTESRGWISLRHEGLIPPDEVLKACAIAFFAAQKGGKEGLAPKGWNGKAKITQDAGDTIARLLLNYRKNPMKAQKEIEKFNREKGNKLHGELEIFYRHRVSRRSRQNTEIEEHFTIPGLPSFTQDEAIFFGTGVFRSWKEFSAQRKIKSSEARLQKIARTRGFITPAEFKKWSQFHRRKGTRDIARK